MRHWITLACLAVTALVVSSGPAAAQGDLGTVPYVAPPGGTSINGRAVASDAIMAVLLDMQRRPVRTMTADDAGRIRDAILADGTIDDAEFDLLDELASWDIRAINIAPASGAGATVVTGTVSGPARDVFDGMFAQHYAEAWNSSDKTAGWAELLRQSRFSETGWRRVMDFLTGMTLPAARAAVATKDYKPVTDLITDMTIRSANLPEADRDAGKRLAFQAWKNADLQMQDAFADYLYVWLLPKPAG